MADIGFFHIKLIVYLLRDAETVVYPSIKKQSKKLKLFCILKPDCFNVPYGY